MAWDDCGTWNDRGCLRVWFWSCYQYVKQRLMTKFTLQKHGGRKLKFNCPNAQSGESCQSCQAWSWSRTRRCTVVSFQVIPRGSFLFFLFNSVAPRYYLLVLGHTIFSNLWDDVIHSFATCNLTCTCKMFNNLPCHVKRIKCTWPELRSCIYDGPKKLRK